MFWNNFYKLCTDAVKTPTQVAADIGLSTAVRKMRTHHLK